ncbi:hypothetical protein [Roseixanthobacter pseudopolyaromaticivorans]|uniref:hypothetical protein n=1 Tax=Xanthobacteraceae TaxID=335928 RepID=UPI00372A9F45
MTLSTPRPEAATLLAMLRYRRPASTKTERYFIERFIEPLGVERDAYGNLTKRIGDAPVLWSCHTDTVHSQGGKQKLAIEGNIVKADGASNCLGADCTTGVWLMAEMIKAGKPGLYVFHRDEEIGGHGSNHIAHKTPELLDGIKMAIAFDRYGTKSIITHQWGGRCCSDVFAKSLGAELGLGMEADDGGSFTDTANYTDLVGECTNVSVGYLHQHTKREQQDVAFALRLLDALLALDVWRIQVFRQPGDPDPDEVHRWKAKGGTRQPCYTDWMDDVWGQEEAPPRRSHTILSLVRDHPDEIADWLEEHGIGTAELLEVVQSRGGPF